MPRKGYRTITVKEEVYKFFHNKWETNKDFYQKQGITSFAGFVTKYLADALDRLELDETKNRQKKGSSY